MKKVIFGAVVGAAIAVPVTYLITKKKLEEEISRNISMEYKEIIKDLVSADEVVTYPEEVVAPHNEDGIDIEIPEEDAEEPVYTPRTDYSGLTRSYDDGKPDLEELMKAAQSDEPPVEYEDEIDEHIVNRDPMEGRPAYTSNKPTILTEDEFDMSGMYEKVTYTWWELSEILTDEDEEIIPDLDGVIGYHNLQGFGTMDGTDPDTMYIRNTRLGLDINVQRDHRDYFTDL